MTQRLHVILTLLLALLPTGSSALAAAPELRGVVPRAGQRGTSVDLVLTGERLGDVAEILCYGQGLTAADIECLDRKTVRATITIAPDAAVGEHVVRVRTTSGVSELQTYHVTANPIVAELPEQPQKIELNCVVAGVIKAEDFDEYVITASQGQRISVQADGMRLAGPMFDPVLSVRDANGQTIASVDDVALLAQDAALSFVAPAAGDYTIEIRDAQHGGADNAHYLLHVGTSPRPLALYPPGGMKGQEIKVTAIGDAGGPIEQTVRLPEERVDRFPVWIEQNGQVAPSPNGLRVTEFPHALESEPNNKREEATGAAQEPPIALVGAIDKPGDHDWFRFTAKKDQAYDIALHARALRSPLDGVVNVFDAEGKHLVGNDDADGRPDSALRWTAPADGEFVVRVRDYLDRGDPSYVYQLEITRPHPQVAMTVPNVGNNSQERQAIVVPRGNRFATLMRITRKDYDGPGALKIDPLPPGVTMHVDQVGPGRDVMPVVFEAAADAALGSAMAQVDLAPADANVPLRDVFEQTADYAIGRNNTPFYQVRVDRMVVSVVEEAPFRLSVVQPKVPIVQNGAMQLKVVAERRAGFDKPIRIHMPFKPPGIGAGDVTIEGNQTEVLMPLNAAGNAQVNAWKTCVMGFADTDDGRIWCGSQLFDLQVAEPYMSGKIEMAAAEQGRAAPVVCKLEPKSPFEGKAKAELVGLPPNTSAEPIEVSASDPQVVFNVTPTDKSPVGQHKSLFVRLTVEKEGEPIVHQFAHGGTLRIDAPQPAAPPPPPQASTERPLSRLEMLRQQQSAGATP